jgi:hypothetical protein
VDEAIHPKPKPGAEEVRSEHPLFRSIDSEDELAEDGRELIHRLEEKRGMVCPSCGRQLCSHQILMSMALGLGNAPRCLACTANAMEESPAELARSLLGYIQSRACFQAAWEWANREEKVAGEGMPSCMN